MSPILLLFRNLWYYRRPWLAIGAGMAISIAVLTGALIIGDSVRYSLQKLTDQRLGNIRFAIESGERTFRDTLASELGTKLNGVVVPALQSEGIAKNNNLTINNIKVYGINASFQDLWDNKVENLNTDEAILSANTAFQLGLKPGDEFLLKIKTLDKIPKNAPFVSEKTNSVSIRLKVKRIANDNNIGRFSLNINQAAPFNIFINLGQMASLLKLSGYANLLLVSHNNEKLLKGSSLDSLLRLCWKPVDAGINIHFLKDNKTIEITSTRIFLDSTVSTVLLPTIQNPTPILSYLTNSISTSEKSTPYSFICAANNAFLHTTLKDNEIIFSDWLAADLEAKPGDSIRLKYYIMGPLRTLKEETSTFILKSILPLRDAIWNPALMPDFPGITETGNCRDWETGTPIDLKKIRKKDEAYWKNFHGTPKAFISIKTGQKIWHNPFGNLTAIRFSSDNNNINALEQKWMQLLNPSGFGLMFHPVYEEGKTAATNATDFGSLFISLSFFLIVASLILIGMLFSLHTRSRLHEAGILSAIGFRKKQIIKFLFTEALIISVIAGFIGALAGIAYNNFLIAGLNSIWQDAVRTSALETNIRFETLLIGSISGISLSLAVIFYVLRKNLRQSLAFLLKNTLNLPKVKSGERKRFLFLSAALILISILLVLFLFLTKRLDNPLLFMLAGSLLLAGLLAGAYSFLGRSIKNIPENFPDFRLLLLKNLSMNPARTVGIISLLALGAFSVMITGANHRSFFGSENEPKSGTGGVLFWAETALPIAYDLNTTYGKKQFALDDEPVLEDVRFIQIPKLNGNDASCLNLNQVNQPTILGINSRLFDKVGMFSFTGLDASVNKQHPWTALQKSIASDLVPAYADQTVITWGLRKSVGDTLLYLDEFGKVLKIKLMGGLDNSIFEGNILISDSLFLKHFPSSGSSTLFLVQGPFAKRAEIAERLQYLLQDQGIVLTAASQRLADFNSVQNTYLSVFMLLGGLGVVIGTLGLGFFLWRNTQERQGELAIYLAIGFRKKFIRRLLITEYILTLIAGLGFGIITAIIAIIPSFVSPAFEFPALFLGIMVLLIFLSGVLSVTLPVIGQKSILWKSMTD